MTRHTRSSPSCVPGWRRDPTAIFAGGAVTVWSAAEPVATAPPGRAGLCRGRADQDGWQRLVSDGPGYRHDETAAEAEEAAAAAATEFVEAEAGNASEGDADGGVRPPVDETPPPAGPVDMIVIADLDFVGDQFFEIRAQAPGGLNFDNVTFFLNAIDTLVGDSSFIELRSRRARHRTLERVEARTAEFIDQRTQEEQQAEQEAEEALTEAQARLNERVQELQSRTDIDAQTKQIMVRNLEEVENRRLEVLSTNIETEKETKIQASREMMESQIRQIQTTIKTFAILLPPVPVLLVGVGIFVRRQRRAREGAAAAHRLKE